jgi:hypothetical protein
MERGDPGRVKGALVPAGQELCEREVQGVTSGPVARKKALRRMLKGHGGCQRAPEPGGGEVCEGSIAEVALHVSFGRFRNLVGCRKEAAQSRHLAEHPEVGLPS